MTLQNLSRARLVFCKICRTRYIGRSLVLIFLLLMGFVSSNAQDMIIGHDQSHLEDLKSIPLEWIDSAKAKLKIVYWHTSHGSQITTGMEPLDAFMGDGGIYVRSEDREEEGTLFYVDKYGWDLSANEGNWPQITRDWLDDAANADINVVMWSWCQILGHDGGDDPGYCSRMEELIAEYGPGGTKITSGERVEPVQFVFMTGHVNGQGEGGTTDVINTYIRDHCVANNRILFDFADIEVYDPDDNYFLDDYVDDGCAYLIGGERTGNWATEWTDGKVMMDGKEDAAHSEPNGGRWYDCEAAHTHALNGNLKAYAAWNMFARMAGWEEDTTGQPTAISPYPKSADAGKINVFPNPSSDFIQVGGDMAFPLHIRIYNMTGRLIREDRLESGDQQLDVSGLPEGLFIIRINGKSSIRTASFIKK